MTYHGPKVLTVALDVDLLGAGSVFRLVECLPSGHEALGSINKTKQTKPQKLS